VILYLVYEPSDPRIKVSADTFEIVNEALLVHPFFEDPCSLTSASSIRPEPFGSELKADLLMAEGSRVATGSFNPTSPFFIGPGGGLIY